jgi:CrcB protein
MFIKSGPTGPSASAWYDPPVLMAQILFVGMGGFLGSVARYLLVGLLQSVSAGPFPLGTLAVNVIGCVAVGGLSQVLETSSVLTSDARAFLVIGLLGGFTTFSAFGNETVGLLRQGGGSLAGANVLANVLLALGGVWLGRTTAQFLG